MTNVTRPRSRSRGAGARDDGERLRVAVITKQVSGVGEPSDLQLAKTVHRPRRGVSSIASGQQAQEQQCRRVVDTAGVLVHCDTVRSSAVQSRDFRSGTNPTLLLRPPSMVVDGHSAHEFR